MASPVGASAEQASCKKINSGSGENPDFKVITDIENSTVSTDILVGDATMAGANPRECYSMMISPEQKFGSAGI